MCIYKKVYILYYIHIHFYMYICITYGDASNKIGQLAKHGLVGKKELEIFDLCFWMNVLAAECLLGQLLCEMCLTRMMTTTLTARLCPHCSWKMLKSDFAAPDQRTKTRQHLTPASRRKIVETPNYNPSNCITDHHEL